jgi:GTP pyrophosphokinase
MPLGSTPVDFAYSVHTQVGHKCVGARINGKMVPLRYQLKNGDAVEIITSTTHGPSRDWLKFVVTHRAKTRIKQWIKKEERAQGIELGMNHQQASAGNPGGSTPAGQGTETPERAERHQHQGNG